MTTWAEISNLAIRKGYETQPLKQWFAKPLALRNQGVFTVDNAFCREVENIGSKNQWSGLFRKYKLNGTTRKVSDMDTHQYFTESAACNLHMGQLVQYQIPIGLQFCSTDAILTQQQWYTKGHVEEGGDDSVSMIPFGRKLFIMPIVGLTQCHCSRRQKL